MAARATRTALLVMPLLLTAAANSVAQEPRPVQDSLGTRRSEWLVGFSVGVPGYAGEPIPELRVLPDKYLPHRYAGASGDFNPIHIDKEFAIEVGLPGNILHGLYGMAQVARANSAAVGGDPRALRRLSVQFRGMALPEQEIVVTGTVREIADGRIVVDTEAEQAGKKIIKKGEAELSG